ncbi:MAG: DUF2089 family protein [Candidatus Hydrogenedentota bacterium]
MRESFPIICPSCGEALSATGFICKACNTSVEGEFELPLLMRLAPEERALLLNLLLSRANLKTLARMYRMSYPTVRNRVDALRAKVEAMQEQSDAASVEHKP